MVSVGASSVLGQNKALNSGSSTSLLGLPFLQTTTDPAHQLPREWPTAPVLTTAFPSGCSLVLSAPTETPLVTSFESHGPSATGTVNIILQVSAEPVLSQVPPSQVFVLNQAPVNWSTLGTISGAVEGAPTLLLAAPAVHTVTRAPNIEVSKAKASLDDSCNPRSVYKNFQRWQRFKTLARSHLPQSPDGEALSCFFIPVLRSLSCLTPTMSLEEGLSQAMQEWQRTSSFDRRKYYEMAAKFMEFEAEEEMQIQQLQELNGSQYLPPVAPPKPDPPGLLIPEVIQEQGCSVPRKACLEATPSHLSPSRASQRPDPKGPKDIPPEVMQEYVDIMEGLLGYGGQWAQDAVQPGQEDGAFPDLGLLSYMEELCSQGEFVTKVEAVLHPQFLAELLSPKPGMDLLALMEELEQEDRLTPDQLVEKRLRALKEDRGEEAAPGPGAPILGSSNYKPVTSPDSERHDHGPYDRISLETHLPKKASQDSEEHHRGDADLLWPKDTDIFPGRVGPLPLSTTGPASPRQGHGLSHPCLGTRGASGGVGTSPVRRMCWPADGSSEDEEQLPSLAFFMASPHSLLPWVPALSPAPTAGHLHPGGCRPRGATKARSAHRRSLSSATHLPSKSKKRDVIGGSIPSSKKLKVSELDSIGDSLILAMLPTNHQSCPRFVQLSAIASTGHSLVGIVQSSASNLNRRHSL
ncbi:NUT family member 2G [Tupaia chinensis]|uniref:NUT family member 2G n=1 Tax=Tupaia chinensis TaxID=246437 RepID=UPI000FFB11D2|nr:NUT family member 2G [Tupaia chinensis]